MTEFSTIKVERFRDPEGRPTCCRVWGEQWCQFIGTSRLGMIEVCRMTGAELMRDMDKSGWLRPCSKCPVWDGAE